MRNVWRVFTRDLKRLGKVPLAWVIIGGALITPALYAWLNIVAFWNPFDNVRNLDIAVVSLDEGADNPMTGELNVGDQLIAQLKDNHDLGWQFMTEDEAMESIKSGSSYAAFVVPKTFSKDLLSITTGDFTQPKLQYYVNEKLNGVAPEITNTGATTVQTQMIDSFTEQVAEAAATAIKGGGEAAEQNLLSSQSRAISELGTAQTKIGETRAHLEELSAGLTTTRAGLASADTTIVDLQRTFEDLKVTLNEATTLADEAQAKLLDFTTTVTSAYAEGAAQLAAAAAATDTAVSKLSQGIDQAQSRVDYQVAAIDDAIVGVDSMRTIIEDSSLPDKEGIVAQLDELEAKMNEVRGVLSSTASALGDSAAAVEAAGALADNAFADAAAAARAINSALADHVPALQQPMAQLVAAAHSLSAVLDSQSAILGQARQLLTGLDTQLGTTTTALGSLDSNLSALEGDMSTAITDLQALSGASAWQQLSVLTSLNPKQIAEFMSTPVVVKQHTLFETKSYGSLMGSLFINLALWIGSFVLVVILKLEVDREGISNLTERQQYMGRWLLFAAIAVAQALVLGIGNLLIGVQNVNAFAFVITQVFIGLSYLSIIYALSVTFGYIGKGLCVILVIMQIPGASGIYPIELMPQFFQQLYPFFPFTYGIDAMRETVSGFAGFAYWRYLGTLLLFVALAFFLGLVLRKRVANLTRLLTQQVGATELFTGETGAPSGPGYRLSHLLRALANRARYQERLAKRALPFAKSYKKVRGAILVAGAAMVVLLSVLSVLLPSQKTALVGWWIVGLLVLFALLITLEYIRYSLRLSTEVSNMSEAEIRRELTELEADR